MSERSHRKDRRGRLGPAASTRLYLGSAGPRRYELLRPMIFEVEFPGGCVSVVVPAGFVTDFASVPRFFWRLFPPDGPWSAAAVVHDWLCGQAECSRFLADAIFREAMRATGVPSWQRTLIYLAVRCYAVLWRR